jgi:hypothetical protein
MGKTKRQGRHAKQKPWERDRRPRPNQVGQDQPPPNQPAPQPARTTAPAGEARPQAGAQPQADVRPQAGAIRDGRPKAGPSGWQNMLGASADQAVPARDGRPKAGPSEWQNDLAEPPGEAPGGYRGVAPPRQKAAHPRSNPARAEELVSLALQAQLDADQDTFARCAAQLAERPGPDGWQRAVERELIVSLVRAVTAGWRQGWQPAEVVREIGRRFDARHARMATDVAALEMRNYARTAVDERWQAQLTALGAIAWWGSDEGYLERWRERERVATATSVTCALEVLLGLATLPRLGRLCPLPGTARPGAPASQRGQGHPAGQDTLGRARTLLAQAETTELPEKAESLTWRAQELLASRSMGDALATADPGPNPRDAGGRRLFVDSPYESAKAILLDAVAEANQCRAVWHKDLGLSTVFGFAGDLDAVELIFASLQVQAATAMVHADDHRGVTDASRTRSFRQSFLASYAERVGEGLDEAAGVARRRAAAGRGGPVILPALAARRRVVDEALVRMFPDLTQHHAA